MFLLDTKQNFTSALLLGHTVGKIPVAGSHILTQTAAIIIRALMDLRDFLTGKQGNLLTGRFLPSPLHRDPLSAGGR